MLSRTLITTLALFSWQTLSAPTRSSAHCQCKIVSTTTDSAPTALETPSNAHWTPANPSSEDESSSPIINDICASLGSQLEQFKHTDPELYDLYMRGASSSSSSTTDSLSQKPIPTSVLLSATKEAAMHDYSPPDASARKTTRKIVCFSAPNSSSQSSPSPIGDFHASPTALCILQLIVVLSILACIVEGIHLLRSYFRPSSSSSEVLPKQPLRLTGSEKRLLAIPTTSLYPQETPTSITYCSSPGAEKKLRAYEEAPHRYFATAGRSGRREFIAYDDDSDDEVNRPVM